MQLEGKVFAVTGGGDGIGREVVLGLLRAGARVAAVDRSAEGLAATRAEAVNEGAFRVVIGKDARFVDRASRIAPRWAADFITRRMQSLLERR